MDERLLWEYNYMPLWQGLSKLAELGLEGWHLVCCVEFKGNPILILERPLAS